MFQIWTYDVSHSQLLLRSPGGQFEPQIDVHFVGVRRIDLPANFEGLRIRPREGGFTMDGMGWAGAVDAVGCQWIQGSRDYTQSSALGMAGLGSYALPA